MPADSRASALASASVSKLVVFTRMLAAVVLVPGLAIAAITVVVTSWHDLPAQVPTHWNAALADGFGPPVAVRTNWLQTGVIFAAAAPFVALGAWYAMAWNRTARMVTAVAAALGVAVTASVVAVLAPLRGLSTEQAALTGDPSGWVALTVILGTPLVAALLYPVLPRHRS